VESFFVNDKIPENVFVLDFTRPPNRSSTDPAYGVVKQMLGRAGYLSQFMNFNNCDHGSTRGDRDAKRSNTILQGVARQVLSKCGVRVWWVHLPRSVPMPCVFVGVDVFHAPRKYDPKEGKRIAKESCAAVVVQLLRGNDADSNRTVEIYSETERRETGKEVGLGNIIHRTVKNALQHFKVNPMSCIVWRDGVGDTALKSVSCEEIPDIRRALVEGTAGFGDVNKQVSLAYVVCQKRVATKFLTSEGGRGILGMPAGALVQGLNASDHEAFYINATSPSYSTPKPVRFIVATKDEELNEIPMPELAWALCHEYPNWTGPIKLPAPVQMAHKLAELAGSFTDCGDSIRSDAFVNRMHFL